MNLGRTLTTGLKLEETVEIWKDGHLTRINFVHYIVQFAPRKLEQAELELCNSRDEMYPSFPKLVYIKSSLINSVFHINLTPSVSF